jgi:hypothetical protein
MCPSRPESLYEIRLVVGAMVGQGYAVIGLDYLGKGDSQMDDAFMVHFAAKAVCVGTVEPGLAGLKELGVEPGRLCIGGWSQGGWTTYLAMRAFSEAGIKVDKASAVAAPTDIFAVMAAWLRNPSSVSAVWLPSVVLLLLFSFEKYYPDMCGLPKRAVRSEFLETSRDLYDGRLSMEEFYALVPHTLQDIVRPEFIELVTTDDCFFARLIGTATTYDFPRYPFKAHIGSADEAFPEYILKMPLELQQLVGVESEYTLHKGIDHRGVFVEAMREWPKWFAC